MNGINILNQTEIMEYTCEQNIFYSVLVIVLFISAILFVIGLVGSFKWSGIIGGILFLITIITIGTVNVEKSKNTGRYKYEVTIDDDVPFTEIYKKYDVVEQKGDIWVLKDKEVKRDDYKRKNSFI